MQTPFTNNNPVNAERYSSEASMYELESPLIEPSQVRTEMSRNFNLEPTITNESSLSSLNVYGETGTVEMEGELTPIEVTTALALNPANMVSLSWGAHLPAIIEKLTTVTGIEIRDRFTKDIKYDMLANAIDRYQLLKGLQSTNKGVMAIGTWSALQDDLGFLNYDKLLKIDIDKAVKANTSYKDRLWGKHVNYILKYFNKLGIIRYELPLDGKYFALVTARWQSMNDNLKFVPNAVDGILGPKSWEILRTELEASFPGYEVKAHVKTGDTAEAARRFVEVMKTFGNKLVISFDAIENKVDASLRNEKIESSLLREGIYLVADAVLDLAGESKVLKIPAAFGKVALGLVKKHYEEKEENARRAANLSISNSLSDIILTAKNAAVFLPDQKLIQHQFDDTISSLKWQYKNAADKFIREEFENFLNVLIELENTVRDDRKMFQIALSKVMGLYSSRTRIVVHCQNQKPIEEWTQADVTNIINDPDRKRLLLRFSRIHPQVNAEHDLITSEQRKILKAFWNVWLERRYPLRDLLVEKHVIFRVHFIERVGNVVVSYPMPVAYDVYIKTMAKTELRWTDSADISGRVGRTIQFFSKGKGKTKGMEETNENGLMYKNIILTIVNTVMRNEFNTAVDSQKVGFVEAETTDEPTVSEAADEEEIYGINESELNENETLAAVFTKQPVTGSSFLAAAKNVQAVAINNSNLQKSGLSFGMVMAALEAAVDVAAIRQNLLAQKQANPSSAYIVDTSGAAVDSVFTEAIHQFQIANYINPKEHDGIMGISTLDSLGFLNHGLRRKLSSAGFYGQSQLNRSDVKSLLPSATNNEFTNTNWFNYILYPSWLGIKISNGVHVLLLRKLREAEAWLLKQPQYQNMTPAALGKALGFTPGTAYSAARLSADNQAMHAFGLAIDINVAGNPWIGAGWVQKDLVLLRERTKMIEALRAASGNKSLPGDTVFAYLHSIATSVGKDTLAAFKVLKQRNDEFIAYLKSNSSELNYWKSSQTFANRSPLNGFLNHHPDLVYALRQVAGLAWGAIDFGPRASGDIMHFDLRTLGVGKLLCEKIGGYVPKSGQHPAIEKETEFEIELNDTEVQNEFELHEAIEEAKEYETEYELEHTANIYQPEFETEEQY